jgi:hypothetical protein
VSADAAELEAGDAEAAAEAAAGDTPSTEG